MRVVDFTAFWAGPAATHALAAFGADVIKIEAVQRPDGIRYSGGMRTDVDDWWEYGWVFHAMNTNKRSVTLDMQSDDGIRLVKELVRQADIVIENFSPRVMEQFRLTAEALLEINPKLVVVRMPAFGLSGPWRDRVGFAPTMEQIAGLAWVTGLPDGPPVAPRGACDPLAGAHAAFVALAALEFADRTGLGQLVEVPMIETVLNVTAVQTMEFEVFGTVMERRGNRGHTTATQDIYRCAGDDNWVAVSVDTDDQHAALAKLKGGPDVPLADWLASQDADVVVESLAEVGIPAAVVISPTLVTENPQLVHRGFFERLEHPRTGPGLYPCPPFARLGGEQVAASDAPDAGPAQRRGAHGAVRADRGRPGPPGRRGGDRHPPEGPLASGQGDRYRVEDRHVVGQVGIADLGFAQADIVCAAKQFVEHRTDFGAGQHGAEAVMRSAAAERHMRVLGAADVEGERVVEHLFVAVGRAQHRDHPLALRNGDAVHLHVDLRAARPERHGRRPPQHLLDRARPDRFIGAVPLDLFRVGDKGLQSGRPARSSWCRCPRTR